MIGECVYCGESDGVAHRSDGAWECADAALCSGMALLPGECPDCESDDPDWESHDGSGVWSCADCGHTGEEVEAPK